MNKAISRNFFASIFSILAALSVSAQDTSGIIVLQSDKGNAQGAIAQMKGVILSVDSRLQLVDSSHEIQPFNVWEAAQRLSMTIPYFPAGTVFVSAVDNGPLGERRSVVMLTKSGHFIASPDNGTLTLAADVLGVEGVWEIQPGKTVQTGEPSFYTYHARDIFAQAAAEIASGQRQIDEIGTSLGVDFVALPYERSTEKEGVVVGTISLIHEPFGNLWTNIDRATFDLLGLKYGDDVMVTIAEGDRVAYQESLPFVAAYPDVERGSPLLIVNNVGNISVAISFGNFAAETQTDAGAQWSIRLEPIAN